jgi:hypothetical protein
MAPIEYSVQTQSLINMAHQIGVASDEFNDHAKSGVDSAAIPFLSWPVVAMGTKGTYENARNLVSRVVDTGCTAMKAIDDSLNRVAVHYERAEEMSKLGHAVTKEITTPPPPTSSKWSPPPGVSFVEGAIAGLADAALLVGIEGGLFAGMSAVSAPFGASVVVLSVHGLIIALNMRDPIPWFMAQGHWDDVNQAGKNAGGAIAAEKVGIVGFKNNWTGDGADAFSQYIDDFSTKLRLCFAPLAFDLGDFCQQMGNALMTFDIEIVLSDIAAIVAMLIAYSTAEVPPVAAAAIWIIVAAWAGTVGKWLTDLVSSFTDKETAAHKVSSDADSLASQFFTDARKLQGNQMEPEYKKINVDVHWSNPDWAKHWTKK